MTTEAVAETDTTRAADTAARDSLLRSYAGKLCPYLTIASMKTGSPQLVGSLGMPIGGGEGEAIACQGPNCMLFVITGADAKGRPTCGACSQSVLPSAIMQLRDANLHIANEFIGKYKIRPIT